MNLLLLLSALLSAITGVNAGNGRVAVAAEQTARASQAIVPAAVRSVTTVRPEQTIDRMGSRLTAVPLTRLTPLVIPAFASRRRE